MPNIKELFIFDSGKTVLAFALNSYCQLFRTSNKICIV